jgi:polysaccharide biosynthesis/export protein
MLNYRQSWLFKLNWLGLLGVTILGWLVGCVPYKRTVYLKQKQADGKWGHQPSNYPVKYTEYGLQSGDVIMVSIGTAGTDPKFNAYFNDPLGLPNSGISTSTDPALRGYTLNDSGQVVLPLLGKVGLDGLTIEQAQDRIRALADDYVENPVVRVTMLSFYVSLIGEFNRPGRYTVYNRKLTLLDALALGGDLSLTANREVVRLVRIDKGVANNYFIDLSDEQLFASPLFYLRPGDVLYVEPLSAKARQVNTSNALAVANVVVTAALFIANIIYLNRQR